MDLSYIDPVIKARNRHASEEVLIFEEVTQTRLTLQELNAPNLNQYMIQQQFKTEQILKRDEWPDWMTKRTISTDIS